MKYAASLLLRGVTASGTSPLWELIVVCIDADDEDDAREKAFEAGERHETEYETATGDLLRWKMETVHELEPIDPFPPTHGSELFSCFLKAREARSLMEPIEE